LKSKPGQAKALLRKREGLRFWRVKTTATHRTNVYDSLAEACAVAGKKELAIENYEKSVKE
jgi:hypothetical protein